jgi:hypothetical protein
MSLEAAGAQFNLMLKLTNRLKPIAVRALQHGRYLVFAQAIDQNRITDQGLGFFGPEIVAQTSEAQDIIVLPGFFEGRVLPELL